MSSSDSLCRVRAHPHADLESVPARPISAHSPIQHTSTSSEISTPYRAFPTMRSVLHSPGQPLDRETREFMEQRLGHDFSRVRVHADADARQSAEAVNAFGYTLGRHVILREKARTPSGLMLLAHELTHVAQQTHAGDDSELTDDGRAEVEAEGNGADLLTGRSLSVNSRIRPNSLQRQRVGKPTPVPLDADAESIVSVVMPGSIDKRDRMTKAVELVYRILNRYFPGYASKVAGVGFSNTDRAGKRLNEGLEVEPKIQAGTKNVNGFIWVGDEFVNSLIKDKFTFAGHVAKVAHELEHIDQWRDPKLGPKPSTKNEREFRAHYHEAVFVAPAGVGAVYHSTRARHLDVALGLYYCLDPAKQTEYEKIRDDMLARRPGEAKYGHGVKFPNPPTSCKQPEDFGFDKVP